jgi:hypothetical protein
MDDDCGMTPILTYYDGLIDHSYKGESLLNPFKFLSDSKIARHWPSIAQYLTNANYKDVMGTETMTANEARRYLINEAIETGRYCNNSLSFDRLAYLWQLAGFASLSTTVKGYCQGDIAHVLAVQTPAWLDMTGAPKRTKKDNRESDIWSNVKTYAAWAFGDVYGFTCEDSDGNTLDDASVWGFYGTDHESSGLLEYAQNAIDCEIKHRQQIKDSATHDHFEVIGDMYRAALTLS